MFGRKRREPAKQQTAQPKRPMEAVVAAIEGGARSRAEIRRTTGLTESTVDAVVHHLERTGRLTLEELGSSCVGGNCNSCIAAAANGMTCADKKAQGPVALVLTKRPGL